MENFNYDLFCEKVKKLKVLLIGETIIDEYVFVTAKGRATKDPILSTGYISDERYLGGVLAPARHLSEFIDEVHVISILGELNTNSEFILSQLKSNITFEYFIKPDSPTIIKKRYIEPAHYQKLFKIEYLNDEVISDDLSYKIIDRIEEIKDDYDLILINDFGHGLFSDVLVDYFSKSNKFIALNVQTNSSNYGYNPITKYNAADFVSMNKTELQLPYHSKNINYQDAVKKIREKSKFKEILLTLGKDGCIFLRDKAYNSKSLVSNPIDTIGAGDAVFSLTSLLSFLKYEGYLISKFANIVGAVAVEILGNKQSITKQALLKYIGQTNGMD